jgi:hypothetical protein
MRRQLRVDAVALRVGDAERLPGADPGPVVEPAHAIVVAAARRHVGPRTRLREAAAVVADACEGEVGPTLASVEVGHHDRVVLRVDANLPVERVRLQDHEVAPLVAVLLQQVPGVGLVVLRVAWEDDRAVAAQGREREPPELDVGDLLRARVPRAEPA